MKRMFLSATLLIAATSLLNAQTGISGKYTVHNSIAGNDSDQECTLTQTDKTLSGSCKGENGDLKLTGTVDGKKLTWKYDSEYNGTPITLTYNGTLDDSGTIKGDVTVDPYAVSGEFTATAAKADPK